MAVTETIYGLLPNVSPGRLWEEIDWDECGNIGVIVKIDGSTITIQYGWWIRFKAFWKRAWRREYVQ